MSKISRPYQAELLKALNDPVEAAEYLNVALEEESSDLFLLALQNVAEARGIKTHSDEEGLDLDALRRALFEDGNAHLSTLSAILKKLGLRLAVEAQTS